MFISDLDNHVAARKIVLGEIRKITGSKFKEKFLGVLKQFENKSSNQKYVFGPCLSSTEKLFIEDAGLNLNVPKFLHLTLQYLHQRITTEFLLRKGGSAGRQRLIRKEIELDDNIDNYGVHDIASLLKQWLRELKEPLIPLCLQDLFLKCNTCSNADEAILNACLLLPIDHLVSLRYLAQFLNKVAEKSQLNKMDVSNICVVMTPNIMPCSDKNNKLNKDVDRQLEERRSVMKTLMKVAPKIGFISESLQEKFILADTNYLKSSEDELERSNVSSHLSHSMKKKKRKSIMSEWRKKLVGVNISAASSKENIHKLHLTPGPRRKNEASLSAVANRKRPYCDTAHDKTTPKQLKTDFQLFTPTNTKPNINFTHTPVSQMSFNSVSSNITPRHRRSSRSAKSGCFKTPKSRSKNKQSLKDQNMVAARLAGELDNLSVIQIEAESNAVAETPIQDCTTPLPLPVTEPPMPKEVEKSPNLTPPNTTPEKDGPVTRSQKRLERPNSILRGRPNTIRSGLPSPYRQPPQFKLSSANNSPSNDHNDSIDDAMECDQVPQTIAEPEPVVQDSQPPKKTHNFRSSIVRREKSVSTPNLYIERRKSLRKINSVSQLKSYTGAKFAPLSKETEEILQNIGEMVTPKHSETVKTPEQEATVEWTSGEKFFQNVLQVSPEGTTKRESVLRIQRDNAGNVRANVSKFNDFNRTDTPRPEFKTPIGIVPRTPRRRSKRGAKTPVRIPSVFVRSSDVTNSIRNRYKNMDASRRASLRVPPTLPLTTFVKHAANCNLPKRRHSSVYKAAYMPGVTKSPLRDSNVVNIRMAVAKGKNK